MSTGITAAVLTAPLLAEDTFNRFRALIREKTGISMRDGKQILIANRLRRRLHALGMDGYEEYYRLLSSPAGAGVEMHNFIDAVSTNETYFFREGSHFDALTRTILPALLRSSNRLRIWSAGCSTGEEVYTLRIIADQAAKAGDGEIEIIGTDISTTVVRQAREGIYGDRALRLVPVDLLEKHFTPRGDGAWQASNDMRARVEFRVHNLFHDPPPADRVDVIFCRNVMIYFDKPTQAKLVDGVFAPVLRPNGFLCIGHSESLTGISKRFAYAPSFKAPVYTLLPEVRS